MQRAGAAVGRVDRGAQAGDSRLAGVRGDFGPCRDDVAPAEVELVLERLETLHGDRLRFTGPTAG